LRPTADGAVFAIADSEITQLQFYRVLGRMPDGAAAANAVSWTSCPLGVVTGALEARLYANAGTKQGHRRHVEPDRAAVHD
jgi:hypothetical protein